MTNTELADLLRKVSTVYILTNQNRFRTIAYQKAADAVEGASEQIYSLWESGRMHAVSGIGVTMRQTIEEYFTKGNDSYLIKTIYTLPESVFTLMKVPGIGPKKAYKLVTALHLEEEKDPFKAVLKACKANLIAPMDSFGEKSQKDIADAIVLFQKTSSRPTRILLMEAEQVASDIEMYLKQHEAVSDVYPLGSMRRKAPTIGDVDLAVTVSDESAQVLEHFVKYRDTASVEAQGGMKSSIILHSGLRVDVRIAPQESLGAMLQYFTGSKAHNIDLREYALRKGYSLSEHGIKTMIGGKQGSEILKFDTEEAFYEHIGLPWIPPELREGSDEIDLARRKKLPKLVELKDVKADLQMHSNYPLEPSHDMGADSYEELLKRADQLNYSYIAFTDHNPSISNHTEEQIVQIMSTRKKVMDETLSKLDVRCKYYISLEVDIRPDGSIALPEKALAFVDFILVSIHSSFKMDSTQMTKRILRALSYPKVKVFAHPTARLLGGREPISADWQQIFNECADKGIALEINGAPQRLDLPESLIRLADRAGCMFSLGTDAHALPQLDNMQYAVNMARRGGLEAKKILNTGDLLKTSQFLLG